MNAQIRTLFFAAATAVSTFAMTYQPTLLVNTPPTFPPPPQPVLSSCTTASNTIAVGIDYSTGGARILCADAGQIGFWTTPVAANALGATSANPNRFLCPSGSALSGSFLTEGIAFPLPICSVLIPNLQNGTVTRGAITMGSGSLCAGSKFVQALQGVFDAQGALSTFNIVCNPVVTNPAPIENFDVDLAIRTINQKASLSHNGSDSFTVQVFNTGMGSLPAGNVRVEFRFNPSAWDLVPASNVSCQPLLASSGTRLVVVGERCTMPGTSIGPRGGSLSASFTMQPVGPASGRPVTGIASPIVSAKVVLTEGTAPNDANDRAAFPVTLF